MFGLTIIGYTVATVWALFVLLVWIAIAFWPARVAARKGHSFFGFFVFSLIFFPLALLVAYMSGDSSGTSHASAPAEEE